MPMLCFLPWTSITQPVRFGAFHLTPAGVALEQGDVDMEHHAATGAILQAYDRRRPVDQQSVPLLRRSDLEFTSDLIAEQITEYFEFRTRLTFAVLAARQFFSHRYANSDNSRLIIQEFTPEHAGAAVLEYRRRDGSVRNLVPAGRLSVPRPGHVSGWCELPKDVDVKLLAALEAASVNAPRSWPGIAEGIRLFVGANTDSPGIDIHSELIDVVGAFSRLADQWDEKGTVQGLLDTLPDPSEMLRPPYGPKASDSRVRAAIEKGESIRAVWLKDAYILRSQFGHGRVIPPPYRSTWSEREHLLLAAVIFPLYVKAVLEKEGLYSMTDEDLAMNAAFDALALLAPFSLQDHNEDLDAEEAETTPSWQKTITRAQTQRLVARWELALTEQQSHGEDEVPDDPTAIS